MNKELEEAKQIVDTKIWDLMNDICGECIIDNNERDTFQKAIETVLNYIENSISKETIKEKEKEINYRLNEIMITERDMYYNLGKKEVLQEILEGK